MPSPGRDPERICAADVGVRPCDAELKPREQLRLTAAARDQVNDVHRAALADPVDASDALLEPHRIPRQLQVDDESARLLEIESLARGIGREQQAAAAARELLDGRQALVARQAPP